MGRVRKSFLAQDQYLKIQLEIASTALLVNELWRVSLFYFFFQNSFSSGIVLLVLVLRYLFLFPNGAIMTWGNNFWSIAAASAILAVSFGRTLSAAEICTGYGPQNPRDISTKAGTNSRKFALAPSSENLNLCNIHLHAGAEHKGPGFSLAADDKGTSGFICNDTPRLKAAELEDATHAHGACHGIKPGDTVEVHWVYSSCDVEPGESLRACYSERCANPQLRVEAQVFLLVTDVNSLSFSDFDYNHEHIKGFHKAKSFPTKTGKPIVFRGSTTGPDYTEAKCSPFQVTWSVRPTCAKLNISTLHKWCEKNVFKETHAHGVRPLVTSRELLSSID